MILETFRNRYFRFILTGLLLLALFPICSAYADDFEGGDGGSHDIGGSYPNFGTVWYGPKLQDVNDGYKYRYGVVAYTQYDAAFYCCIGSSALDFNRLSAKKKQKLLAESDFYSFANTFKVGKPDLTTDNWSGDAEIVLAWQSARVLYGETYCYNSIYGDAEKQRCTECIQRVLNEDDSSGGGGTDISADDAFIYNGQAYIPIVQWSNDWTYSGFNCLQMQEAKWNSLVSYAQEKGWQVYAFVANGGFGSTTIDHQSEYISAWVMALDPDNVTYDEDTYSISFDEAFDTKVMYNYVVKTRMKYQMSTATIPNHGTVGYIGLATQKDYTFSKGVWQFEGNFGNDSETGLPRKWPLAPIYYASIIKGTQEDEPENPDEPEPDPPVWPSPPSKPVGGSPDVPTPGDPIDPTPPDPVDPTPGEPWIPIPGETVDITGEDFQDLIDALDEHCQHLQAAIQSNVSQLWSLQSGFLSAQFSDLFSSLDSYFGWLGTDVIVASFTDLKAYLKELFDWLSERMDFNIQVEGGQYDDTSVVYWLKQIWAKLGDGINTQPTDPVVESDDWWAWFLALMGNFVAMLLAFGADKLGDVTSAVQTLAGKFPFCLPWDLAAMFALLDATPVIPSFDLPCFALTSGGLQEVGQYHITLEAFDGVWEGIRWVERLGFVVMLVRYTDKLMSVMRRAVGR